MGLDALHPGRSRLRVGAGFIPSFEWCLLRRRNVLLVHEWHTGMESVSTLGMHLANCALFVFCVRLVRVTRRSVLVLVPLVAFDCHSTAAAQPVRLSLNSLVWPARFRNLIANFPPLSSGVSGIFWEQYTKLNILKKIWLRILCSTQINSFEKEKKISFLLIIPYLDKLSGNK